MVAEPIRVLLVDDERSFREPLTRYIRRKFENIELVPTGNYDEALRAVRERPPNFFHVSVIDEVLVFEDGEGVPAGNGLDLMEAIREYSPHTEHIIYTGWGTEHGLEALRAGAYHLSKSAPRDELILHIQAAAEKGRLKVTAHEKQLLEQLVKSGTALLSEISHEEVLDTILRGVQTIGYDRVRLYWISDDGRWLEGVAQVGPGPEPDFVGSRRAVETDYYLQRLLDDPYPQRFDHTDDLPDGAQEPRSAADIEEWVCVPLLLDGKVVGKLSADHRESERPVRQETFQPLMLFATQAAAAIVTAQLRTRQRHSAAEARQRADKLEAVQRLASAINSTLDVGEIARTACQAVVELFDVDHSGFLYADADLLAGRVLAEYPDLGTQKLRLPLKGIPREEEMIDGRRPVIITDVATEPELGAVGETLRQFDIQSILLVPVVYRDRLYGSFSLDLIGRKGDFPPYLVELCCIVADQLAVAFHNAELFESFAKLRETSLAVTAELDRTVLLDTIIGQATELLEARQGGIYEYFPDHRELRVVAACGEVDVKGRVVKEGEGMAGQLLASEDDVMIVDDYSIWEKRSAAYEEEQPFGAVIEVKLKWQGQTKGVLYLDDDVGRRFSDDDAYLLRLFADQASIALTHANMVRDLTRRTQLLDMLNLTTREILSEDEPQRLLHQTVRRAAELMACDFAGLLVHYDSLREMELKAAHGFPKDTLETRLTYAEPVLGRVALQRASAYAREWGASSQQTAFLREQQLELIAAAPLMAAEKVEAILFVADKDGYHPFNNDDLEVLERFAATAAVALQRAQALDDNQRGFAQLRLLHSISDFMQSQQDLQPIFHAFLTGVTAGYGLGFNRAALFLLDDSKTHLIGKLGIGDLDRERALEAWKKDQSQKTDTFPSYLERRARREVRKTPLEERVRSLPPLPLGDVHSDLFARVVRENQFQLLTDENLASLPADFRAAFEPAPPGIVLALRARGEVTGLVVVDNKFTQIPVLRKDIDSLLAFSETAAGAIDRVSLLRQTEEARARLEEFFEASNDLVLKEHPEAVLDVAVARACRAAEAQAVSLIIMDESRRVQDHYSIGPDEVEDPEALARSDGLSAQIMDSQQAFPVEDCDAIRERLNPSSIWQRVRAALGLPLIFQGKAIGVLWVHYSEPRPFSPGLVDALQLYANHAALVYDSVRRINELTALRQVAEALARATDPEDVLASIVAHACKVLKAQSACLYPYDAVRGQLDRARSAFEGIPAELVTELRKDIDLRPDGTTAMVFEGGWLGVEDIADDEQYGFIGDNTRSLLQRMSARSFQALAVKTAEERLGILYVNYERRRFFGDMERQTAEAFANQAAAALANANLAGQIGEARQLAGEVARITVLGNVEETLQSIAAYTRKATDSDAVVVYAYDRDQERLSHRPAISGLKFPEKVSTLPEVEKTSLVWKMLRRRSIYIAKDAANDRYFKNSRFTRDEKVKTVVAIPLRYGGSPVGVMFVNYRQRRRLGRREKDDTQLFANQAAVAIYNAQTHARLKESIDQVKRQEALIRSRTAAAWVGMMSSTWAHRMSTRLSTIRLAIKNLRVELDDDALPAVAPRLDTVETLVAELLERPVVPDLRKPEADLVDVNHHLQKRFDTLWAGEDYQEVTLTWQLGLPSQTVIRVDPVWLREVYDIVIDNAIAAMQDSPVKTLTIITRLDEGNVEICFKDTGRGIPEEVRELLFKSQVPKPPESKGWGTGLLLAQVIVETFEGTIGVSDTGPDGTEIFLRFPMDVPGQKPPG